MKKLLVLLIGILFISNISLKSQTNDSLLNVYNNRLNRIELNLNNFVKERNKGRITVLSGIGVTLIGVFVITNPSDKSISNLFLYGGMGITLIGTVQFNLADIKLITKKH